MAAHPLQDIALWRNGQEMRGIPSICSAHPLVLEAAMRATTPTVLPLLIEATCNQVNHEGGYTGMVPADFCIMVWAIADRIGFPRERIILGGDHLGPNPWRSLHAEAAMQQAETMIRAYAAAGFTKLHLDCSMACVGDPAPLPAEEVARRAARLAAVAEAALPLKGVPKPVYVIGTEVPIPGGALEPILHIAITAPEAAEETVAVHHRAFEAIGLSEALGRIIALVVQPGVEFSSHSVVDYNPGAARPLSLALRALPALVFEAHSTDYQTPSGLAALVRDGFAILKVGPGLTFALRQALFGLDSIAEALFPRRRMETLSATLEAVMLGTPENWACYYEGTANEQALQRRFSYSDRIRYYWQHPDAAAAVTELFALLEGVALPETLISQYLGAQYLAVREGRVRPAARDLVLWAVEELARNYIAACVG